jgi:hypothetical protein
MTDEPAGSAPFPAAAVEVAIDRPPTSFADGVITGIAAAAVLVQLFLAWELGSFSRMYKDFGGQLPAATRLVLTSGWRLGLPGVGAAAIAALIVRRPRASWPYVVVALVIVAATLATWWFARMPLYELAGNIRAD